MDQDPSEALAFFVRKLQGPTRPATELWTTAPPGQHRTPRGATQAETRRRLQAAPASGVK